MCGWGGSCVSGWLPLRALAFLLRLALGGVTPGRPSPRLPMPECVCARCTRSLSNAARKQALHNQKKLRLFLSPAKNGRVPCPLPHQKESPWQPHPGLPKPCTPCIVDGTAFTSHVCGSRRPDQDLRRVQTTWHPRPYTPAFLLTETVGEGSWHLKTATRRPGMIVKDHYTNSDSFFGCF